MREIMGIEKKQRAFFPFWVILKKEKARRFRITMVFFFILFSLYSQTEAKIKLTCASYLPPSHPWIVGTREFGKQIVKNSGGEIIFDLISTGISGKPSDMPFALKSGKTDIAVIHANLLSKYVMPMKIFELPFLFNDIEQAKEIILGHVGDKLLKEAEKNGFAGISFLPSEFPLLVTKMKAVSKLDDLRGLKIRTSGIPIAIETYRSLGASPVTMPGSEIFHALQGNVIDGATGSSNFLNNYKIYEVTNYATDFPISYSPGIMIMNYDKWKSLSQSHKVSILKSIPSVINIIEGELISQRKNLAELERKLGIDQIKDIKEFKKATKPIFQKALFELPQSWANIATNISYKTFDLRVISSPVKADVYYSRRKERYERYKEHTNCTIPNLCYAIWKIRVSLKGYKEEEKLFDPFIEDKKEISFELKEIKK